MAIPAENIRHSVSGFEREVEELESLIHSLYPAERIVKESGFIEKPEGEQVPVCVLRKKGFSYSDNPILYIWLENRIFLDGLLPDEVRFRASRLLSDRLIYLVGFASNLTNRAQQDYALSTMYALSTVDVKGKRVLDAGCADGMQGVVALKNGARQVIGIEEDHQRSWQFWNQLTLHANEIPFSQFTFMSGEFQMLQEQGELNQIAPDIIVANIGPEYKEAHLQVIDYAGKTASVKTFVGGGYGGRIYPTDEAYQALEKNGFRVEAEYHHARSLAFVATR